MKVNRQKIRKIIREELIKELVYLDSFDDMPRVEELDDLSELEAMSDFKNPHGLTLKDTLEDRLNTIKGAILDLNGRIKFIENQIVTMSKDKFEK